MKKLLMLTVATLFSTTINASAEADKGGFKNNTPEEMISVSEIAELPDGEYVIMQGNILEKTGEETYNFKDKTGSIVVEIDGDSWAGITVTPNDIVIIEGEVDKSMMQPTVIEVEEIRLVK